MMTNQRTLFPEPAIIVRNNQPLAGYKRKGHTFPLDPQGTIWLGLPPHEYISLCEPLRPIGFDTLIFDMVNSGWV